MPCVGSAACREPITSLSRDNLHRAMPPTWLLAGSATLVLGLLGALVRQPSRFVSLASPLGVTVGIVLVSYAVYIYHRFFGNSSAEELSSESKVLHLLCLSLVIVLLLLSLFWTVSHYAGIKGVDLAIEVERRLSRQPSVIVYSSKRLHLHSPVLETELGGDNSAYHYAYTGLKFLFFSDNKYFLRPSDPVDYRNIIIPESQDIRMEFFRER
jgi:hypothetical protein